MALPGGPTGNQVRQVDTALTKWINSRAQSSSVFIADQLFQPDHNAGMTSGTYFRRLANTVSAGNVEIEHADGADYARVGFPFAAATFNTREFGVEVPLPRRTQAMSQVPLELKQVAAEVAEQEVMIARELRVINAMFGTGDWTNEATLGAAAQWDDPGADPLANIWAAIDAVELNSRQPVNVGAIGFDGMRVAVQNADLTGLMPAATRQTQITFDELAARLASAFGIERLLVGRAVRNTANLGAAETPARMWTDNLWLGYVNPGGSVGSSFAQFSGTDGSAGPTAVDRYFSDKQRTDVVRVREDRAQQVVDVLAGYLIINLAN